MCSEETVRSRVRVSQSWWRKKSLWWEGLLKQAGFSREWKSELWMRTDWLSGEWTEEEVTGAGKGESQTKKPIWGCRTETVVRFQRQGEVHQKEKSVIRREDDVRVPSSISRWYDEFERDSESAFHEHAASWKLGLHHVFHRTRITHTHTHTHSWSCVRHTSVRSVGFFGACRTRVRSVHAQLPTCTPELYRRRTSVNPLIDT